MKDSTARQTIVFTLLRIIDHGSVVSLDEMDDAISNERALDYIENEFPDEVDLSLNDTKTREEIEEDLQAHHYAYGPGDYGIKNNGLILLASYLHELGKIKAEQE